MTRPGTGRRRPRLFVLAGAVFLSSCFDPPVREELSLRFLPNGAVVATSTVAIAADQDAGNPALARRLAETRRAILDGADAWGARFAAADPAAERFFWEKRLGDLSKASRSAVIAEPRGLEAFFRDTSLAVTYTLDAERGMAELAIVPGPSSRATRRQRESMERTIETWSAQIANYLAAGGDLYAYLAAHGDRARPCLGTLFSNQLSEKDRAEIGELTAEEKKKVERLDAAMQAVIEVLVVPAGEDTSPDEISHLVYDPFPARLAVKLPVPPLKVEGFAAGANGALVAASPGLWEALQSLEGRWLAPDPVLFYVAAARQGRESGAGFDSFLETPPRTAPVHLLPAADEVRAAIVERLKPAPIYRAAWKVRLDDDAEFRWEAGEGSP